MVTVEREEVNRVERGDAWRPVAPILERPIPHPLVLPSHLTPTHPRPRPRRSRPERVRIRQPTKFTRLRSSTHACAIFVPKGVATTCRDGADPATADPTHQPIPVPRSIFASRACERVRARPTSRRRKYDAPPGFPSSLSPPICAVSTPSSPSPAPFMVPALVPPSYVFANPSTPPSYPGVRTRDMTYRQMEMCTPRSRSK